jgi:hypothetical protein
VPDPTEIQPPEAPTPSESDQPLTTEALRSADEILRERLAQHPIPPEMQKRGRGRPPGSPNKPKDGQVKPPGSNGQKLSVPRGTAQRVDVPKDEATMAQKAAAKKARAEELTAKIQVELNEHILDLFMSMGVPTDFLYKPGRAPSHAPANSPYTDLGQKLAINPMAASAWGKFAAELEATDVGGKLVGAGTGSSTLPLILSGLFALGAGLQYAKGVQEVLQNMQTLMQAKAEYERQQQAQDEGQTNG